MMKKKIILFVSIVLVSAICSGIAIMAYANGRTMATATTPATTSGVVFAECTNEDNEKMMAKACEWSHGWLRGWGRYGFVRGHYGFVEVSEEFEENVINIAKNDTDVQALLNDGYNITGVRPIIKAVVEANGDVVIKATSAVVMLCKDTTGKAFVWVDVEEGKVTRIEILTRTVIEKP